MSDEEIGSSNVRIMPGTGGRDPNAMLQAAQGAGLENVTIVGWDAGGTFFISSSYPEMKDVLWDLVIGARSITDPE